MPKKKATPKADSIHPVRKEFDEYLQRLYRGGVPELSEQEDTFIKLLATFYYGSERFLAVKRPMPKSEIEQTALRHEKLHYKWTSECVLLVIDTIVAGDPVKVAEAMFELCQALRGIENAKALPVMHRGARAIGIELENREARSQKAKPKHEAIEDWILGRWGQSSVNKLYEQHKDVPWNGMKPYSRTHFYTLVDSLRKSGRLPS